MDEEWRQKLHDVLNYPGAYGIPTRGEKVEHTLTLGMDETPLLYCPQVRGTYSEGEERKQVVIIHYYMFLSFPIIRFTFWAQEKRDKLPPALALPEMVT